MSLSWKFLTLALITAIASHLIGCTTVQFPIGHLQTPEVPGGPLTFTVGAGVRENRILYLAPDSVKGSTTAQIREASAHKGQSTTSIPIELSFAESFSLYRSFGGVGLQWQMLGSGSKAAKAGNFAVSILAEYSNAKYTGTSFDLAVENSSLSSGSVNVTSIMGAFLIGYRFSDQAGLGLNLFSQNYDVKGTGFVDGSVTSENLSLKTTDLGVGLQLYGGTEGFSFFLSPVLLSFKEAVRETGQSHLSWAGKMNYSF